MSEQAESAARKIYDVPGYPFLLRRMVPDDISGPVCGDVQSIRIPWRNGNSWHSRRLAGITTVVGFVYSIGVITLSSASVIGGIALAVFNRGWIW